MSDKSATRKRRTNRPPRQAHDIKVSVDAEGVEPRPAAPAIAATAPASRATARLLTAMGLASIKAVLEPMVRSVRRRALLAVVVGLLWLAAICYAFVALTMLLALWLGPVWATAAMALVLALAGIGVHLAARSISRARF